ncbi:ornithine cyclodeaminase [Oscillochloris sp. ZM17-4]|uniref:ornithine cyclodeaminase family protein n=1 Tax=Oscillochloris sp. ZM17-4 TaxID=2866714 RepID=UPI001C733F19|nr:ornithine cyclodeaminase [Oscillochloris sp. ZM17-4]MBX0330219.1 ornithine cyclodeaminase [Oscillochloris sp. ZM17-4]
MHILSADDVRRAVPMAAAIDAVEAAFVSLAAGDATVPLRTPIEIPEREAVSLFMPARIAGPAAALGMKVVNVFPQNARGLAQPTIYALVSLFDPETGRPLAVLDGTYLTSLRTGAASGVATRHMARADASCLAVFGAGAQALPQILAVCAVRPIRTVWIVNRSRDRAALMAARLRGEGYKGDVLIAPSVAQALAEADVICTATSSETPLFADSDLRPGTHINAVGAYKPTMAEVPAETVARARLIVDQRAAAWAEAGDLIQARAAGLIDEGHVVGEIGEVAGGALPGRTSDDQITMFKSVGNAVQDLAVGALAIARAAELGLGVDVSM